MTMTRPQGPPLPADGFSLADLVERLSAQFAPCVSLPVIVRTVRRCRRELDIAAAPLVPEQVELLARHRLSNIVAARGVRRR
jgi:hypothetical protein